MRRTKFATDKEGSAAEEPPEPKIDAVLLIPEPIYQHGQPVPDFDTFEKQLHELHERFAGRFTYPFVLTVRHGLVKVGVPFVASDQRYIDLTPSTRHLYLKGMQEQLETVTVGGRQTICLVGSVLAQALRRLGMPFSMPLAAMSRRARKDWLERACKESNAVLLNRLFGRPIMYPTPTDQAARPSSPATAG